MDDNRAFRTRLAVLVGAICGVVLVIGNNKNCQKISQNECLFLWGLTGFAILGGVLFAEAFTARRKNQIQKGNKVSSKKAQRSIRGYYWSRAVVRISLTAFLLSLPIIAQGAFGVIVFGFLVGLSIDMFIRGIKDQLPPENY